jgi:hypothetical protein
MTNPQLSKLISTAISIAIGWAIAWLVADGISFIWPSAKPWVFYWFGGMWTLAAITMIIREVRSYLERRGYLERPKW